MKCSMFVLATGVAAVLSGVTAHAGVLSFTLAADNLNGAALSSGYQPLAGITVTYSNISTYNGSPDSTSGLTGTDNYFVYPSNGDYGTMTFTFDTTVMVPSFYYDNFHGSGAVVANAWSGPNGTGTDLATLNLASPPAATWAQSTGLAAYDTVRSLTFTNSVITEDAVNIDDITVIATPEPASLLLAATAVFPAIALHARRRRKIK